MIPVDRQTLTLIAVIVCMVGLVLMFKELRTAKEDVEGLKGFSMNVMKTHASTAATSQSKDGAGTSTTHERRRKGRRRNY
jgi:hypothetical protein